MTDFDKINECRNSLVTNIYEPEENALAIEIILGRPEEKKREIFINDISLGMGKQIIYDDNSEKFTISFNSYISYFILNESFDGGFEGEYTGNRIRLYTKSAFIDFCKRETLGFQIIDNNAIKHFMLVTQRHIINVLTISELIINKA
jgi:hypothetical protein